MQQTTFKYVLIGLYIIYMLVMMSILLWGSQRTIFLGSMFFPLLIIVQVYYILRFGKKEKPGDEYNEWYQHK